MLELTKAQEEEVQRALTDQTASPLAGVYDIEELEKRSLILTPKDTPFFTTFRGTARKSINRTFEWVEVDVQSDLSLVKYNGYSPPSDVQSSAARASNRLMAVATVARVGAFAQALDMVDGDAMMLETQQKFIDLVRGIEYFLWQGDDTNADETDGIVERVVTAVDNGSVVLSETILQTAIVNAIVDGGMPDKIFCSPIIAQRIANFTQNRIDMPNPRSAEGGIGINSFKYLTPFGYICDVIPTRSEYMSTGQVFVLDSSKIALRYAGNGLMSSEPLDTTNHGRAVIMYSFMGLQIKGATKFHRVITNVTEALS